MDWRENGYILAVKGIGDIKNDVNIIRVWENEQYPFIHWNPLTGSRH
jgi:hypothetical protein